MLKGIVQKRPASAASPKTPSRLGRGGGRGIFFLLGLACMGLIQVFLPAFHSSARSNPRETQSSSRTTAMIVSGQQKPWGDFEYTKLPLEEPREFLPKTAEPLAPPRWFFGLRSRKQVEAVFHSADLTPEQREALLKPGCWQVVSNGFYISPSPALVLELSRAARERIYGVLDDYPANSAQCHPFRFRSDGFDEWFADSGLGEEQLALLRKLVYSQGGSLCFCDGAIVQSLFSAHDFNLLVKALYGERTFLMKVRLTPETNMDALMQYWGRSGQALALRPLFESIAHLPGGGSVGVGGLLPTFARLRLYTYANPAVDPMAKEENCFWTAMNFFNETPDNRFLDSAYVQRVLTHDYKPITDAPTFGDLIAVQNAPGALIHLCVYLADDVVFTKNGRDSIEPWVLMKVPDMIACYRPKDSGRITTFRAKP